MKSFLNFFILNEALPREEKHKYRLIAKNHRENKIGAYSDQRLNEFFNGKDRIFFKFEISLKDAEESSMTSFYQFENIFKYRLKNMMYDLNFNDYLHGIFQEKRKDGKTNQKRISKVLEKLKEKASESELSAIEDLEDVFKKDESRRELFGAFDEKAKTFSYWIVFSRHPYDIAGMSTDRHWTSCMNIGTAPQVYDKTNTAKPQSVCVDSSIREGAIIAYLVQKSDFYKNKPRIHKPVSRILMNPYWEAETDEIAFSIGSVYGQYLYHFRQKVTEIITTFNQSATGKVFYRTSGLYNDGDSFTQESNFLPRVINKVLRELIRVNPSAKKYISFGVFNSDSNQLELIIKIPLLKENYIFINELNFLLYIDKNHPLTQKNIIADEISKLLNTIDSEYIEVKPKVDGGLQILEFRIFLQINFSETLDRFWKDEYNRNFKNSYENYTKAITIVENRVSDVLSPFKDLDFTDFEKKINNTILKLHKNSSSLDFLILKLEAFSRDMHLLDTRIYFLRKARKEFMYELDELYKRYNSANGDSRKLKVLELAVKNSFRMINPKALMNEQKLVYPFLETLMHLTEKINKLSASEKLRLQPIKKYINDNIDLFDTFITSYSSSLKNWKRLNEKYKKSDFYPNLKKAGGDIFETDGEEFLIQVFQDFINSFD